MNMDLFRRFALLVTGLSGMAIGAGILFLPHLFHGASGIVLGTDPTLMSEIRAPGAALLGAGVFIIASAFVEHWRVAGLWVAFGVAATYGAARFVSMALDGLPGPAMYAITGFELALAAITGLALLGVGNRRQALSA